MTKADLRCMVCCCSAFLPDRKPADDEKGYYDLLGVGERATIEEIKKAYRKRSLEFHPDKIAQRRGTPNEVNVQDFQRIKEAYETLMDPRRRDIYDVMGHKAMSYVTNPSSIEAQTIAENLAKSSFCDRLKVVLGLCLLFGIFLIQPILICCKVQGYLDITWFSLFIPTWFLNTLIFLFLISMVINARKYEKKEQAEEDAPKNSISTIEHMATICKFCCIVSCEVLLIFKFDDKLSVPYSIIFIPVYVYEVIRIVQAIWTISVENGKIERMVTIRAVEEEIGKAYGDLSEDERDSMNKRYIIVHTPPASPDVHEDLKDLVNDMDIMQSLEFQYSQKRIDNSYGEVTSVFFHVVFLGVLIPNLDVTKLNWNWWLVFLPIWIRFFLLCGQSCFQICFNGPSLPDAEEKDEYNEEENDAEYEDVEYGTSACENEGDDNSDNHRTNLLSSQMNVSAVAKDNTLDEPLVASEGQNGESLKAKNWVKSPQLSVNVDEEQEIDRGSDPEVGGDDEDVYEAFEEGEDTSSAVEATLRAIASCCSTFFYIIVTCLFVGKLQGDSYSSFWVIFPILLPAGLILCCFGCAIFCFRDPDILKNMAEQDTRNAENSPTDEETFSSISFLQEFEDAKAANIKSEEDAVVHPTVEPSKVEVSDMDDLD